MISAGYALFLEKQCAHCHGEDGAGGVNLTRRVLDACLGFDSHQCFRTCASLAPWRISVGIC
jgi:cytochrome c